MYPNPAPVQSPATAEPKASVPPIYSSVIKTEVAHPGIIPISAVIKGCIKLSFNKTALIFSSPTKKTQTLITSKVTKTNKDIFSVWIKAFNTILFAPLSHPHGLCPQS